MRKRFNKIVLTCKIALAFTNKASSAFMFRKITTEVNPHPLKENLLPLKSRPPKSEKPSALRYLW